VRLKVSFCYITDIIYLIRTSSQHHDSMIESNMRLISISFVFAFNAGMSHCSEVHTVELVMLLEQCPFSVADITFWTLQKR
jgi:hypothetical protein